jgi:L-iditol 2-dehydrogenase
MKAAFLDEPGRIRVREVPEPRFGADEVLVRIHSTGICGSDLHYFRYGRVGDNVITEPHILGHESSGVVEACGDEVTNLKPGDRVAVEPGVPCLKCHFCLSGRYNLCPSVQFLGAPPYPGTFREYVAHKALFTHKLPENVSCRDAAFAEPLAVGYNAAKKASLHPGDSVLITGAGAIGLSCLQMMRLSGSGHISIADRDRYRLELAKSLGADRCIVTTEEPVPAHEFDCVIEATGSPELIPAVVDAVKKGGRIVIVGMSNEPYVIDSMKLLRKEASMLTVYRYANFFLPVLRLLESGRISVDSMLSHVFSFPDIEQAFLTADDSGLNRLKIMVEMAVM